MLNATINFKHKKTKCKFDLVHNLDEFGLNIEAAFTNWSVRTKDFTEESFIEYVISKDPTNLVCMSKKQYDKLNK